jgi:membrane protease YdiL (CAAX protease family)
VPPSSAPLPPTAPPAPADRRRTLVEVLGFYTLAVAAAALLSHAPRGLSVVHNNLHALVALVFLVLPQVALRRRGNIERYGFTTRPLGLGLGLGLGGIVVVLPLFTLGLLALLRLGCAHAPSLVPASCWHVAHPVWQLPRDFWMAAAAQVIVTALPEELFFRGYVQGRLEEAFPPTRKLFGAPVGWAWLLQAILFGLGHYFVLFEPDLVSRVFPGLVFGWMFARTRSILAGTLFHAACNLLMLIVKVSLLS